MGMMFRSDPERAPRLHSRLATPAHVAHTPGGGKYARAGDDTGETRLEEGEARDGFDASLTIEVGG
jgi:hypothetical protein